MRLLFNTLESLASPFVVFDDKGEMKEINQAVLDVFGYTKPDLIGESVDSLFFEKSYIIH